MTSHICKIQCDLVIKSRVEHEEEHNVSLVVYQVSSERHICDERVRYNVIFQVRHLVSDIVEQANHGLTIVIRYCDLSHKMKTGLLINCVDFGGQDILPRQGSVHLLIE